MVRGGPRRSEEKIQLGNMPYRTNDHLGTDAFLNVQRYANTFVSIKDFSSLNLVNTALANIRTFYDRCSLAFFPKVGRMKGLAVQELKLKNRSFQLSSFQELSAGSEGTFS